MADYSKRDARAREIHKFMDDYTAGRIPRQPSEYDPTPACFCGAPSVLHVSAHPRHGFFCMAHEREANEFLEAR